MSRQMQAPARPAELRLFVSYSHKDDYWMQALMPLLRFPGVRVKPWNDKEIRPGVRWEPKAVCAYCLTTGAVLADGESTRACRNDVVAR